MQLLDGRATAKKLLENIDKQISIKTLDGGTRSPRIDMILVGDNYASNQYVNMKLKKARETGIDGQIHRLGEEVSQKEVLELVDQLNNYDVIDGFMVQLPLPDHLDTQEILDSISKEKDVDGLGAENLGGVMQGADWAIGSATAKGIMLLLEEYGVELSGKDVVILGRGKAVGMPLYGLMLNADANVVMLHSKSGNVGKYTKEADVVVAAVGRAKFLTGDMLKNGAVVVDVGTNRDENGKLCGDVDFESVKEVAGMISPVPGGVGPMTIAALLSNVYEVWESKFRK